MEHHDGQDTTIEEWVGWYRDFYPELTEEQLEEIGGQIENALVALRKMEIEREAQKDTDNQRLASTVANVSEEE